MGGVKLQQSPIDITLHNSQMLKQYKKNFESQQNWLVLRIFD